MNHLRQESGADIAYGPWIKGQISDSSFVPRIRSYNKRDYRDNLIKALLTNWSIVPHTCLFRRSIVEPTFGGFPGTTWSAEDQFMFLRHPCRSKSRPLYLTVEVARTNDPGKITFQSMLNVPARSSECLLRSIPLMAKEKNAFLRY